MTLMKSSYVRAAVVLCTALALLWIVGLISYSKDVPDVVADATTRTDAIVVLTGGSERIDTGIDLLAAAMAERLFISGTGPSVSASDLIGADRLNRAALLAKMSVGAEAEDTWGNATETAAWADRNGIMSIRLVTAAYHMPRSLKELARAMPDVEIIPHPVFPDQVKMDWWLHPGSAGLLGREYSKYLVASLRLWITQGLDNRKSNADGAKPL